MERVTLKLKYGGNTRRCSLRSNPVGIEEVREVVGVFFPLLKSYSLSYVDEEGDKIVVVADCELQEAVAVCSLSSPIPVLRLDVEEHIEEAKEEAIEAIEAIEASEEPKEEEPKEELKDEEPKEEERKPITISLGAFGEISLQFQHEDRESSSTNTPQEEEFVHRAFCDACRQVIKEIRYKCSVCPDYDLCSECEKDAETHHEPSHPFLKLTPKSSARGRRPFRACGFPPRGGLRRNGAKVMEAPRFALPRHHSRGNMGPFAPCFMGPYMERVKQHCEDRVKEQQEKEQRCGAVPTEKPEGSERSDTFVSLSTLLERARQHCEKRVKEQQEKEQQEKEQQEKEQRCGAVEGSERQYTYVSLSTLLERVRQHCEKRVKEQQEKEQQVKEQQVKEQQEKKEHKEEEQQEEKREQQEEAPASQYTFMSLSTLLERARQRVRAQDVEALMQMGFELGAVCKALEFAGGDLEMAINHLLLV